MGDREPWSIERIGLVLGAPALRQRFLGEIQRAPGEELPAVFARWREIAESVESGVRRGRELLAVAPELWGDDGWLDVTEEVAARAERIRGTAA